MEFRYRRISISCIRITGAPRLVSYLINRGFAKVIGNEKMPRSEISKPINSLEMGDIIAYSSTNKGGYEHLAIHLYGGNIACHTACRLDVPWTDIKYNNISLLHITY